MVSAFLVATIGLELDLDLDLDLDENTAAAADAFRFSEPRLAAVEGRIEQLAAALDEVAGIAKATRRTVSAASKITETTEFALAYLVADRVAHLSSTDVDETNVEVTQRKALAARETIQERASERRTIEKQNDGRRMA